MSLRRWCWSHRELALQASEAFLRYRPLEGFHVLPIYGGQSYQPQLNA